MSPKHKLIAWLYNEVKSPPFSASARLEAGYFLRRLQAGEQLSMPHSRPMSSIGRRCHELRIPDEQVTWRIVYRIDTDAIIILNVFEKKTSKTPMKAITLCKERLREYDDETS